MKGGKVKDHFVRGANWTDPRTGEACFLALKPEHETCIACGKHISQHFGHTEYRCQPRERAGVQPLGRIPIPPLLRDDRVCPHIACEGAICKFEKK